MSKPSIPCGSNVWTAKGIGEAAPLYLVNIDPDNTPWEESLIQRPSK